MKHKNLAMVSLLASFLLYSCNSQTLPLQKNNQQLNSVNLTNNVSTVIKGKTELADFGKSFSIKANPDFATRATVSVIYPNDYHDISLREATVATGLTDGQGNFTINTGFTPEVNQVMILESSKRNNGIGYSAVSLRSHIRWNGTKWESITLNEIRVNKKTTAISIISAFQPDILSSAETINRMSYNGTVATINYNSKFTSELYIKYLSNVSYALSASLDPVKFYYSSGETRAKLANVKSNMHTFQTMIETYAVDWGGNYPDSVENLEQESKEKSYFKDFKNPFGSDFTKPFINDSDYRTARTTLIYKGQNIDDTTVFGGDVTYDPVIPQNNYPITKYFIYGIDVSGDPIQDKGSDFYLTNQ